LVRPVFRLLVEGATLQLAAAWQIGACGSLRSLVQPSDSVSRADDQSLALNDDRGEDRAPYRQDG